jgi:phosphomannomutase|tara:strand:- start:217 stop:1035 length:819 start_codon:yes stop_codon:yes gene_type:complete
MRPIVLFDMDGTLTEPRKKISYEMVSVIDSLTKVADIGIVTGSGIDYVEQQCNPLWEDLIGIDTTKLKIMPCNGTQVYTMKSGNQLQQEYSVSMRDKIGDVTYQELIREIIHIQSWAMRHGDFLSKIPLTGHFLSYRDSLLNWCPVGRDSKDIERQRFKQQDDIYKIRESLLNVLISHLNDRAFPLKDLNMALGGATSIDIYPRGWDKTYALNHVDKEKCYFIGDKCTGNGNDKELYDAIKLEGLGAFEVKSPQETMFIINNEILKGSQYET